MYQDHIIIDGLQYCYWDRAHFERLRAGGVTAVHATLVYHELARETLTRFSEWNRRFEQDADLIRPVMGYQDIRAAKEEGRVGVFFGAQNCSPIEDDIGLIEIMRKLGLLIMQLSYNNQSLLATGCYEERDPGITRFGRQAIAEMNRVGMIVDMSHSAERSTLEAIEISSRPICISHANPARAHEALRNKSDTVLKALADSGGLLGFSLYPFHLPDKSKCTLERFCRMVADTVEFMGIEHVGIGSDLCLNQPQSVLEWMRNGRWSKAMDYGEGSSQDAGWPAQPSWFRDGGDFNNLYRGLKAVGFNETDTAAILGGNWLRFLQSGLGPA
ncbi:membrane dipeptidase [Zobellella maritima]|uniref:membrane dipeptidase n=1 Tax=Zobellella maritima TaxID=2059725 RepID=UPI000E308A89|nr:membrane dipeptidase [Zobellella maritima]